MAASEPTPGSAPPRISAVLDRFVAGFNDNNLDAVMDFFAEQSVYLPGDGKQHRGKSEIRRALEPQFRGVYGQMTFLVDDRVVDEQARKASIRWVCQHDLRGSKARGMPVWQRWLFRLLYGSRFGWYGTDTFHFDGQGKIVGKFSYANYGRPQIRRDLARTD